MESTIRLKPADGTPLTGVPQPNAEARPTALHSTRIVDLIQAIPGYPHDKVEGLAVLDNFTIAVSNDDDFGVTDDGAGNFIAKTLPLLDVPDFNTVYVVRLSTPLRP